MISPVVLFRKRRRFRQMRASSAVSGKEKEWKPGIRKCGVMLQPVPFPQGAAE